MNKQIYKNIRKIRKEKGFTQNEVSSRLNRERSSYSKIENGKTELTINTLNQIATIFNVSTEYIQNYHTYSKQMKHYNIEDINEYIIKLYHKNIESWLISLNWKILSDYPSSPMKFDEFISDIYICEKQAIASFVADKEEHKKNGFTPEYPNDMFPKMLELNEQDLKDFFLKKENYDVTFFLLNSPHIISDETQYKSFKDMIEDPYILSLFYYGLTEGSVFNKHWARYKKENSKLQYKFSATSIPLQDIKDKIKQALA